MQSRHNPELSLRELVQNTAPHTLHILGLDFAHHWFDGVCQTLINHGTEVSLWAKFATNSAWLGPIANYGQAGLLSKLYFCLGNGTKAETGPLVMAKTVDVIPFCLEVNANLAAENFFCFLSDEVSLLILLQEPEDKPGFIHIWQSLSPLAIGNFLTGLKQAISIADNLPAEIFAPPALPTTVDLNLVNELLQSLAFQTSNNQKNANKKVNLPGDNGFMLHLIRELATPLTNMKTALRLLESLQQKKEARQRYLDLIKQNCDHQNALVTGVQELLAIAPVVPPAQMVTIEDCVAGVVGIYQPIAKEKDIHLSYTIAPDCPAIAATVADLRIILQQLLENSLKFTPPAGKVQIKAQGQTQTVEIIVSDTGCGIAMADIPHVFDCFFRGQTPAGDAQGAGLGLTIVQSLVARWGGKITVHSRPGRGSRFQLLLPAAVDNSLGHRFTTSG